MSSCSAASRREAPPSTCAITSMRMSAEYAFGIVRPQTNQCRQTRPFTGPWESCDSIRPEHALVEAFRRGLREAGFVEGQNATIEYRWALGERERLAGLASDLVRKPVSVLVTTG